MVRPTPAHRVNSPRLGNLLEGATPPGPPPTADGGGAAAAVPAPVAAQPCVKCSAAITPGAKFCPECGTPQTATCTECGAALGGGCQVLQRVWKAAGSGGAQSLELLDFRLAVRARQVTCRLRETQRGAAVTTRNRRSRHAPPAPPQSSQMMVCASAIASSFEPHPPQL